MKRLLILLLLLSMLLPLVSCGKDPVETEPDLTTALIETTAETEGEPEPEPEPLECSVRLASLGDSVSIHTAVQKAYFADADADNVTNYAEGKDELSRPTPRLKDGATMLYNFVVEHPVEQELVPAA